MHASGSLIRASLVTLLAPTLLTTLVSCQRLGLGDPEEVAAPPTELSFLPATPEAESVRPSSVELAMADAAYRTEQAAANGPAGTPEPSLLATIAASIGADPTADAPVILTLAAGMSPAARPLSEGRTSPPRDPVAIRQATEAVAQIQTLEAMATSLAASPTPSPVVDPGSLVGTPEPACRIPREPFRVALAPAPGADPAAIEIWRTSRAWALEAELRELGETEPGLAGRGLLVTTGAFALPLTPDAVLPEGLPLPPDLPRELPAGLPLDLSYQGPALPLRVGQRYLLAYDSDQPEGGDGEALLMADEDGLRFLSVSLREAEGAQTRLLAGLRAGFEIRQLPTNCRYVELDGCGFELRAAPLQLGVGDRTARLAAGESGVLELERDYRLRVATSHFRLWRGDQPCADPADWPRSFRIEALDGSGD